MKNFLKKILLSVPFITFLALTLLDMIWLIVGRTPEIIRLIRDGVLLAALIMLVPLFQQLPVFKDRRILHVLRKLGLGVFAGFVVFMLVNRYLMPQEEAFASSPRIYGSTYFFALGTLAALFLILLHVAALGLLRILVFYKSKSGTLRNYRVLLLAMLFFAAVNSALGRVSLANSPTENGPLGIVAFVLVIILIVLNAFRTAWIQFLNRRQKWLVFLLAVLVCAMGGYLTSAVRSSFVAEYSVAYASLVSAVSLYLAVYAGVSAFLLFFSLPTAGLFDEKIDAIKSLQELTQSISHFMEKDKLTAMITQRALQVTKSDFAWLELYDEKNATLELVSAVNLTEEEKRAMPLSTSSGISGWVIQNRKSLLANDTHDDARMQPLSEWKNDIGALLAVPLISRDQIFGILYSAKHDYFSYDQFDQDMLQSYADQAAIAFENARLLNASLEKERLAQELRVAHEAQEKLLPKTMPKVPGLEVAGTSIAAQEVGGDYYDVFQIGGKLAVIVGDVSGKGTAAAFYMAQVKGVMEALVRIYESPREVLIQANQILTRSLEKNLFISLIYAVFDPANMRMTLSRAGHNPLLWYPHDKEPTLMQPRGLGIGLDRGALFGSTLEEVTLPLAPGDYFVFYTDGVVEARDMGNREFEEQTLLAVVKQQKNANVDVMKEAILESLRVHVGAQCAHDDFTLVVVGVSNY
ncbi:MAG: GAF domain-containing SpoIIE family protein phosphatase [candidate division KSB1 bacterium]